VCGVENPTPRTNLETENSSLWYYYWHSCWSYVPTLILLNRNLRASHGGALRVSYETALASHRRGLVEFVPLGGAGRHIIEDIMPIRITRRDITSIEMRRVDISPVATDSIHRFAGVLYGT
jgi:hypothetical protein